MEVNEWINVREQHATAALLSGVAAFAWRPEGETGVLVVDFIEEADEDNEAYSRARVEGVSEKRADELVRAIGNPSWFRDIMTDVLVNNSVKPREQAE